MEAWREEAICSCCSWGEQASLVAQMVRICLQCGRLRFKPWVGKLGKIPWRRERQPTLVFLPGESHGQRSLEDYSPRGCKELDMTEWHTHTRTHTHTHTLTGWIHGRGGLGSSGGFGICEEVYQAWTSGARTPTTLWWQQLTITISIYWVPAVCWLSKQPWLSPWTLYTHPLASDPSLPRKCRGRSYQFMVPALVETWIPVRQK